MRNLKLLRDVECIEIGMKEFNPDHGPLQQEKVYTRIHTFSGTIKLFFLIIYGKINLSKQSVNRARSSFRQFFCFFPPKFEILKKLSFNFLKTVYLEKKNNNFFGIYIC